MTMFQDNTISKKVQFLPMVRVRQIPDRSCYKIEDIKACWFNKLELMEMKVERDITGIAMTRAKWRSDPNHPQSQHELDGIDFYTSDKFYCERGAGDQESLKTRHIHMSLVRSIVVKQSSFMSHSAEDVAQLYHECSMPAVKRARALALEDEKEALCIFFESLASTHGNNIRQARTLNTPQTLSSSMRSPGSPNSVRPRPKCFPPAVPRHSKRAKIDVLQTVRPVFKIAQQA
jgi:hypothetical protein